MCTKYEPVYTKQEKIVHKTLIEHDILMSKPQVKEAMSKSAKDPCQWDLNGDNVININDLLEFLPDYGSLYNSNDLLSFLAAFNSACIEFPLDIIPAWQTFQQDATNNIDPFIGLRNENGQWYVPQDGTAFYDSVHWYFNENLISTEDTLIVTLYDNDGNIIENGWNPPCNGTHLLTMRVFHDGYIYERSANTYVFLANSPGPSCIDFNIPIMTQGPFDPYDFQIIE